MAKRNNQGSGDAVRRAGHRLAETVWAIPATLVFYFLLYVCGHLFWRDIQTSMWGYQQFPTNKGDMDIAIYVALFFPLLQIAMGYLSIALLTDSNKANDKWGWVFVILTVIGFSFDAGTDILFRVHNNFTWEVFAVALYETLVIYTLATEVALSITIAALIVLTPYCLRDLADLIRRLKTGGRSTSPVQPRQQHRQGKPQQQQRKGNKQPPNTTPAMLRQDPGIGEIKRLQEEFFGNLDER